MKPDETNLPELDIIRFAEDKVRGIQFSADRRRLTHYCRSLENTEYIVPSGITSIGNEAFFGCFELEKIQIPPSVVHIGKGAFDWCPALKTII